MDNITKGYRIKILGVTRSFGNENQIGLSHLIEILSV